MLPKYYKQKIFLFLYIKIGKIMNDIFNYLKKNKIIKYSDIYKSFDYTVTNNEKLTIFFVDKARTTDYIYDFYYTTKEYFEEFWLDEIIYIFESNKKQSLSLDSIIQSASIDVVNIFNIKKYNTIAFDENKVLEIIKKYPQKFNYKNLKPDLPKINPEYVIISLIDFNGKYLSLSDSKVITDLITNILRDNGPLSINKIVSMLNRRNILYPVVKPFENEQIKEIILNNSEKFVFEESKGIIQLKNDLNLIINSLSQNKINLTELSKLNYDNNVEVLVALYFKGEKFILSEAEEYVKTRPIISIYTIGKYDLYIFDTLEIYLSNELAEIIDSLFENDYQAENWMLNNLSASYYYEYCESSSMFYENVVKKLINQLSPVFNLQDNPGNLFKYTLESKLRNKKAQIR